jgi:hypothetical protein
LDSHPVSDLWRVGFAPQPRRARLRIERVLDRIRPSFFSNSFFSPRPVTIDLPGAQRNQ